MKRYIILFTITLLMPFFIQAQNLVDALRYSQFQLEGTARAGAMGNAFGALGGDFTSVTINPAGIGLYRSAEFAVTPRSGHTAIESSYWNRSVEETDYKFTLSNISYVSAIPVGKSSETGLVSFNIGLGYNRLKDFNGSSVMIGDNINGSYLDYFADNANLDIWSDYYEELAWKTDLLLYDENNNEYWHDIQDAGYGQYQRKNVSTNGSIDEYSFAFGMNFNHKLYIGASVAITDLYYRESSQIYEEDVNGNISYFNDFTFNTYLRTHGYGNNFKFGIIFKPINEIRLGVSVHTPTYYKLQDLFETSMQSYITYDDGSERYNEYSPTNNYDYRLQTPLRANFSGAFIIAKRGLISVDYEYLNYGDAKLRRGGDGYNFYDENMEIEKAYKASGNLRIGGELRVTNSLSLRGGYELHQSAYNSQSFGSSQPNSDSDLNVYAAGLGYKTGMFFFDIAYRYSVIDTYDYPYPVPNLDIYPIPEMAKQSTVRNNILFTFGYKF